MIEWKTLGKGQHACESVQTPIGEIYADDYGDAGCKLGGACGALGWKTFKTMEEAKAAAETYLREKLAELQAFLQPPAPSKPADIGRGLLQPVMWVTSDKPRSRADLNRVLDEWNESTRALPRDSGWHCEVLGMMEDAYDLGCVQRGGGK